METEHRPDAPPPSPHAPDLPPRAVLEAMLFSCERPLDPAEIARAMDRPLDEVRILLAELREDYARSGRAFGLEEIAGGFQLLTLPEYEPWVGRLRPSRRAGKLSSAALETLSIIAYKQPVTRAEIESVRGVQAGPILRTLLDRDLIRTAGRAEVIGSPMLYATTERFLEAYGLKGLEDLPQFSDFRSPAATPAPAAPEPAPEPAPASPEVA